MISKHVNETFDRQNGSLVLICIAVLSRLNIKNERINNHFALKTRRVVNIIELNFVQKPEPRSGGITCHAFGIFFILNILYYNNYMPSALKKFGITEMVKLFNQVKKSYECPFTTINIIFRFSLKKLKSWMMKFVRLRFVPFVGIGG